MKTNRSVIMSKLKARMLGEPSREQEIRNLFPLMKLNEWVGLAEWAKKEMGDKYDQTMDMATRRYWGKLDKYINDTGRDLLEAVKNVPFEVPRRGVRKSRRKATFSYQHLKEIESLERQIGKIKSKAPDNPAFKHDMRETFGITDQARLTRYFNMKPSEIAYEEMCRKYRWPFKGRTLEKYIRIERETQKRRIDMLEWWRRVVLPL